MGEPLGSTCACPTVERRWHPEWRGALCCRQFCLGTLALYKPSLSSAGHFDNCKLLHSHSSSGQSWGAPGRWRADTEYCSAKRTAPTPSCPPVSDLIHSQFQVCLLQLSFYSNGSIINRGPVSISNIATCSRLQHMSCCRCGMPRTSWLTSHYTRRHRRRAAAAALPDDFALLQLPPNSSRRQIRAAYIERIKTIHPDVSVSDVDTTLAAAALIAAYERLMSGAWMGPRDEGS